MSTSLWAPVGDKHVETGVDGVHTCVPHMPVHELNRLWRDTAVEMLWNFFSDFPGEDGSIETDPSRTDVHMREPIKPPCKFWKPNLFFLDVR